MNVLIDSNILIYFINGQLSAHAKQCFEDAILNNATYSSITRIEVIGWSGHTLESRQRTLAILDLMQEITLTEEVILKTIQLREQYRIKLPDAIIAASAFCHDLQLMTHNSKDFKDMDIQLFDPFEE